MALLRLLWMIIVFFFVQSAYATADEMVVKKAYENWCAAIGTAKGNPDEIVKFYAPEAMLLPTLSSDIVLNTKSQLDSYFTKLTKHPNIQCTTQQVITHVHDTIATNSGSYIFSYLKDGKVVKIPSRFTFIYRNDHGKWLIVKHHSSKLPLD